MDGPPGAPRPNRAPPRTARSFALLLVLAAGFVPTPLAGRQAAPALDPVAAPAHPSTVVASRVEALLDEEPFAGIQWGLLVVDATTGLPLLQRAPAVRMVPASSVKIALAVAALDLLGPEYRWETALVATAPPEGGLLTGDLFLVGTGDPSLGAPFHDPPERALEALVDSLEAAGIRQMTGTLVVDVSAWDPDPVPDTWMIEDLSEPLAAPGGAFAVRSGLLEIQVRGAEQVGAPAELLRTPAGSPEFVENGVVTGEAGTFVDLEATYLPESRRWRLEGSIPPGSLETLELPQRDPVRVAVEALAVALEARGLLPEGGVRILEVPGVPVAEGCRSGEISACGALLRMAGMTSPPLRELLPLILAESHNWTAEQLVRTLGAVRTGRGDWEGGTRIVEEHLVGTLGIPASDVHLRDGSGLSNHNLLTARALVALLGHAREAPWSDAFRDALARPGAPRSTLERRLAGAEARVLAKTGTLRHAHALSGFLVDAEGHEFVFSILANGTNLPSATIRERIDQIVRTIAGS